MLRAKDTKRPTEMPCGNLKKVPPAIETKVFLRSKSKDDLEVGNATSDAVEAREEFANARRTSVDSPQLNPESSGEKSSFWQHGFSILHRHKHSETTDNADGSAASQKHRTVPLWKRRERKSPVGLESQSPVQSISPIDVSRTIGAGIESDTVSPVGLDSASTAPLTSSISLSQQFHKAMISSPPVDISEAISGRDSSSSASSSPVKQSYWTRFVSTWNTGNAETHQLGRTDTAIIDAPIYTPTATESCDLCIDQDDSETDVGETTIDGLKNEEKLQSTGKSSISRLFSIFGHGEASPSPTVSVAEVNNPILHLAAVALQIAEQDKEEENRKLVLAPAEDDEDEEDFDSSSNDGSSSIHRVYSSLRRSQSLLRTPVPSHPSNVVTEQTDGDKASAVMRPRHTTMIKHSDTKYVESLSVEEKLHFAFDLAEKETYRGEFACWLVKSVLLKGYMYLTDKHICFYATLPTTSTESKAGFLKKRSQRKFYSTYWFVLKDNYLYSYNNSTDLYFPVSAIHMKQITSIKLSKSDATSFKIGTERKTYYFEASTAKLRTEWVSALRAAVFRSRNLGDDVRVVFPISSISELSIVTPLGLNECLRVKVVDHEYSVSEEYYFAYFNDIRKAFEILTSLVGETNECVGSLNGNSKCTRLYDTTAQADINIPDLLIATSATHEASEPAISSSKSPTLIDRLVHQPLVKAANRLFVDSSNSLRHYNDSPSKLLRRHAIYRQSYVAPPLSPQQPATHSHSNPVQIELDSATAPMHMSSKSERDLSEQTLDGVNLISMSPQGLPTGPKSWWTHRKTSSESNLKLEPNAGSIPQPHHPASLFSPQTQQKHSKTDMFRKIFPVPENEKLLCTSSCYLDRTILLLGRIYVSENYVCFNSKLVGIRTHLMVPLTEIIDVQVSHRYGSIYYALQILTRTQEDIRFDFHTTESRNKCYNALCDLLNMIGPEEEVSSNILSLNRTKALKNVSDESHQKYEFSYDEIQYIPPVTGAVPIKPSAPMHITCLTIGTRGDVQPYIGLCKGFMADGHRCRIATHLEYKEWIEGFGIEFREVKGDPAELMQLCVDNGMFTMSFIREALGKFKGWVDELLVSCFEAVQGTDLIIESPTAMGGIHCAEKLGIPYFAAFPMPWTRTRAYPHPFAVPDVHLGGSYNLMSHVMIEQLLQRGTSPQVNRWRKQVLRLPTVNMTTLSDAKVPFLYSFSPSIVPQPPDWQDWIHICGYWFLDNPEHDWKAPASLLEFLDNGTKPVYIGFGSIVVPDPDEMTRVIVEAVKKAGVRAILSKGWSGRLAKQDAAPIEYPDSIYPLDKVPHDWLFPRMAGVVHHGGAGTTAAGLRAGVPTLIRPFFGDQYFWADRVQEMNVGLSLRKLTVDKLAAALVTLTTDTKIRERSALLGEKIQAENGVQNAIQYVYRDMDYARARILELKERNSRSGFLRATKTQELVPE